MSIGNKIISPAWVLLFIAFLIPLGQLQKYFGEAFSGIKIAMFIIFFLLLINICVYGKKLLKTPVDKYLVWFILAVFLSLISAGDFKESFLVFITVAGYLLLIIVIFNTISDKSTLKKIIYIFLFSMVIVSILGIMQFVTGKTFIDVTGRSELYAWDAKEMGMASTAAVFSRVLGTEKNPTGFASHFVVALPLVLSLGLAAGEKKVKILFFSLFFLYSTVLLLTFSRGGMLGAGVGIALVLMYLLRGKNNFKSAFILILIASIAIYFFWPSEANYYLFSLFFDKGGDLSYLERKEMIGPAISMFLDNPIFGVGLGNYTYRIADYGFYTIMASHNNILGIVCDMGIVGLISFELIMLKFFFTATSEIMAAEDYDLKVMMVGLLGSFVGLQIVGLSHTNFVNVGLWFFMGIGLSCIRLSRLGRFAKTNG